MAQVPQTSTEHVLPSRKTGESATSDVQLPFYTKVSTTSCKVFVLFVSFVSIYSTKLLLHYSPAVHRDLPSGGGRQGILPQWPF